LSGLSGNRLEWCPQSAYNPQPVDLPILQPTKFELAISVNAAKALGLTIPQSILLRANELIE
jgi:putative ABC transport system substrate-binding protein